MAVNPGWVIRPAAEADLAEIWTYGALTWGPDQADLYADGLFAVFDLLAQFPQLARQRRELTPPVRIHPSGAHLVIYQTSGGAVEIIRVLQARQDLLAHLLQD